MQIRLERHEPCVIETAFINPFPLPKTTSCMLSVMTKIEQRTHDGQYHYERSTEHRWWYAVHIRKEQFESPSQKNFTSCQESTAQASSSKQPTAQVMHINRALYYTTVTRRLLVNLL